MKIYPFGIEQFASHISSSYHYAIVNFYQKSFSRHIVYCSINIVFARTTGALPERTDIYFESVANIIACYCKAVQITIGCTVRPFKK